MLKLIATVTATATLVAARCPNDCSGKGSCGNHDLCVCYPGYQALDCSERVCLFGRSWGDIADGNDQAHDYSECSSNGLCDRKTGECTCNDGFTGDACRYAACPNDCSGHGTCEYISELAVDGSIQYGSVSDRKYDLWDAKKSRACKCDAYWSGADCSSRMCPKGNDPLTTMTKDTIGGNTPEVQEVQTVDIRPQLINDDLGYYSAIAGDFTLSYTDAYNQEWTTRPIRVSTQISNTQTGADTFVGDLKIEDTSSGGAVSTITDQARRLNLFEPYDTIKITNAASPNGVVTTITSIDCTYTMSAANVVTARPCTMTTMPRVATQVYHASSFVIQLVSTDTGEIGVKRMLQELPNQVVPSITVDETLTKNSNKFQITFSDSANSGDQHMLKCKVASCDTDGCQPRKKAIKGWYRVATTGLATGSSASAIKAGATAFTNLQPGVAQMQRFEGTVEDRTIVIGSINTCAVKTGGTNSNCAAANADLAACLTASTAGGVTGAANVCEFSEGHTLTLSESATGFTNFIAGDIADTQKLTVSQIHDFTDDSIGEITGGDNNGASTVSGRSVNGQTNADCVVLAPATGLSTLGATLLDKANVGDMISVKFASTSTSDGYYKVSAKAANLYTLEGNIGAVSSQACTVKLIAASPCTVTETQRGTSENAECSSRGNCDGQTGLCTCFSGYVGEDCSTQTVLV